MFPTSRRPVPSSAALRVLRQLAYISSGTVCGAAALVAEERRRRTRLAGKIVENSRKLKQHPRYAHSATKSKPKCEAPFFSTENYVQDDGITNEKPMGKEQAGNKGIRDKEKEHDTVRISHGLSTPLPTFHEERAAHTAGKGVDSDAFRNDELPSEIDKGYEKLTRRHGNPEPTLRKGDKSHVPSQDVGNNQEETVRASDGSRSSSKSDSSPLISGLLRQVKQRIKLDLRRKDHDTAYNRLLSYARLRQRANPAQEFSMVDKSQAMPLVDASSEVLDLLDPSGASPVTSHSTHDRMDVEHAARAFMALYSLDPAISPLLPVVLASRLLETALQAGSLEALTDIAFWLAERKILSPDQINSVCLSSAFVFAHNDLKKTEEFYSRLLLAPAIRQMKGVSIGRLLVTASILDAKPDGTVNVLETSLSNPAKSAVDAKKSLEDCCRVLIKSNRRKSAIRLFQHCARKWTRREAGVVAYDLMAIAEELFEHSVRHSDLHDAYAILRHLQSTPNFESNLHGLYLACSHNNAHNLLVSIYARYKNVYQFPPRMYPAICWAHAKSALSTKAINAFLSYLQSNPLDAFTIKDCQPALIAVLERKWNKASHLDLDLIKRDFEMTCDIIRKSEGKLEISLFNAAIRACIKAGGTSEAEELLHQMQDVEGLQPNLTTFGHFALSAAKAREWAVVDGMLSMLGSAPSIKAPAADQVRLFNPVLQEYVHHHSPAEVWSFLTNAIEVHGIVPNQTTTNIVLEAFVHGQQLKLVFHWFLYMQTRGFDPKLGPKTAMRMIRRYYFDFRPSHVLMMWICRNLFHRSSESMSEDLILLLRESIAYDMRGYRGGGEKEYFDVANTRLKLIDRAQAGCVPSPLSWSKREILYKRLRSSENRKEFRVTRTHSSSLGIVSEPDKNKPCSSEDANSGYALDSSPDPALVSTYTDHALTYSEETAEVSQMSADPVFSKSVLDESEWFQELLLEPLPKPKAYDKRKEESEILLSLSLGQPADAVAFYRRFVAANGLPHSSYPLEMAITASIRARNGSSSEAEELLKMADEGGLHVAGALMPLIVQRIKGLDKAGEPLKPKELEKTVLNFYRSMDENRIPVRHHVATTAASVLINNGQAEHGISLLRKVFESPWSSSTQRPFDIMAMTVLWQGYAALQHEQGMQWVVDTILEEDMRIDRVFMKALALARRISRTGVKYRSIMKMEGAAGQKARSIASKAEKWHFACAKRRFEQIRKGERFGNDLVRYIVKINRREPPVNVSTRRQAEKDIVDRWYSYNERRAADRMNRVQQKQGIGRGKEGYFTARKLLSTYKYVLSKGLQDDQGRRLRYRYVYHRRTKK